MFSLTSCFFQRFERIVLLCCVLWMPVITVGEETGQGFSAVSLTPVQDFILPHFGNDGYKEWELRGEEAIYVDRNQINIVEMELNTYSGDLSLSTDLQIHSPKARLYHRENRVQSMEDIFISNKAYTVEGTNWEWEAKRSRFIIQRNVRVIFKASLP